MLQFVTKYPDSVTIPEQVKRVIAGGCRWIELSAPGMTEDELRRVAQEIIPLCKETDAFVIMRDHTGLAAELRLHGMLLDYSENPRKVRQELGGEAVIGVSVTDAQSIIDLRSADIDYAVLRITDTASRDHAVATVAEVREKGIAMPIVAEGEFSIAEMKSLLGAGFSGIALSATLDDAPDTEATTREVLDAIMG